MELNKINSTGNWGSVAEDINQNFSKVNNAVEQVKNATTRNKGYYSTEADLKSAFTTANVGDIAYVGSAYPYQTWTWDGTGWVKKNNSGGDEQVNLGNYYTKEETDGKFDEADEKLSELGSEIINGESQQVVFSQTYQAKGLSFVIPKGSEVTLNGELISVRGRTNKDDEDYQTLNNGTIADRDIKYLKNTTEIGSVEIGYKLSGISGLNAAVQETKRDIENIETKIISLDDEITEKTSPIYPYNGLRDVYLKYETKGYYINTTDVNYQVGDIVDTLNIRSNTAFRCCAIKLKEGQQVISSGRNGDTAKTWIFIGDDNIVKAVQEDFTASKIVDNNFIAPTDGTYYYSTEYGAYPNSFIKAYVEDEGLIQKLNSLNSSFQSLQRLTAPEFVLVSTPARYENKETSSGYFRGYIIENLNDLYNKGIRGLLFRGANNTVSSDIVNGLIVDKDGSVSNVVKNINEEKTNGWYVIEFGDNADYFKGTYVVSEEGGEVFTPDVVYALTKSEVSNVNTINNLTEKVIGEMSCIAKRSVGRIDYTNGEVISTAGYHNEVNIPIGKYDKMYVFVTDNKVGSEPNTGYAFFDSEGVYISGGIGTKRDYATIDVPSNAALFKGTDTTEAHRTCILSNSNSLVFKVNTLGNKVNELETEVKELKNKDFDIPESVTSVVGRDGLKLSVETLSDGQELAADSYPYCNKVGNQYSFSCKVTSFNSLIIAQGYNNYRGVHIEIDNTNVKVYYDNAVKDNNLHGLTIQDFLKANIQHKDNGKYTVNIMTHGGSYTFESSFGTYNANGLLKVISAGSELSSVKLSATNNRFRCPIWIFGASYEGVSSDRWVGQCKELGYFNYLVNGLAGRDSISTYNDFVRALNFGCPKYLYLTIWGNGSAANLDTYIGKAKNICDEKGITLIITNRPNSLASDIQATYTDRKSVIDKYIAMGVRYVDVAEAVSSDESDPNGWYSGLLSSDNKHPTISGSKAIAMQVLTDFPEIMQYGYSQSNNELDDSVGDL